MSNLKIGFIGLGIMGQAMATNLIKAGFKVTVWNRTSERCEALVALGARQGKSPKAVVAHCDITLAMLSDPAAALEVVMGEDGVLEGLEPGKGYIDMSTVDPDTSEYIAELFDEAGGRFLEAPVSGSKKPAQDGTLVILAAGDPTLYSDAAPLFEVLGSKSFFLGQTGQAARMKLAANLVMGGMMAALSEGLAFGQAAGLEATDLLEVLDSGAMSNPMFRLKGPLMNGGDFAPNFPLKHMQKDLRLALELAEESSQPMPTTAAVNESFKRAKTMGLGDADFSAVIEAVRSQRD